MAGAATNAGDSSVTTSVDVWSPHWQFAGTALFALGLAGGFGLLSLFSWTAKYPLASLVRIHEQPSLAEALSFEAAYGKWAAARAFMAMASVTVLCLCAGTVGPLLRKIWRQNVSDRRPFPLGPGVSTLIALLVSALFWHSMRTFRGSPNEAGAFLTHLLRAMDHRQHGPLIDLVWMTKQLAEAVAILAGAAVAATVVFVVRPDFQVLAHRTRVLQRLLYGGSFLFVSGILLAQANTNVVLATWSGHDEAFRSAMGELRLSHTLQSGVGYSIVLALCFIPARLYLHWHATRFARERQSVIADDEVRELLKKNDLLPTWQDELRHLLALLAPILSAPVLDTLLKLG